MCIKAHAKQSVFVSGIDSESLFKKFVRSKSDYCFHDDLSVAMETLAKIIFYLINNLYMPTGRDRTKILFTFFMDSGGYIPSWLANMKQKKLPYDFLKSLEEKAGTTHFELRPAFQSRPDQQNMIIGE